MWSRELAENKFYQIVRIRKNRNFWFYKCSMNHYEQAFQQMEKANAKDVIVLIEKNTLESKMTVLTSYGIRSIYPIDLWDVTMKEIV